MPAPTTPPCSSEPRGSCGQAAGGTGVRVRSERVAPRDRVECDLPCRLRVEMASDHFRRDRALRNAHRRVDRAGCPAPAAPSRCHSRRVRRWAFLLRGVGGAHAVVGCLGLRAAARTLPDPAPGRLRFRRWAGRTAARRSADPDSLPTHRLRLRDRLPCRRPRGDASAAPSRRDERPGQVERAPHGLPRPPLHRLLSSRFVLLLMAYQVLSAAGTYMAEYILFDRAAARFASADSLAQFLSRFTIALNAVSLAFLALLAAPLLRRFGLRLGIAANPAVVLVFAVAMFVSATTAGPESLALFALVASARIADVALTDGVTRASLNTSFQVLPLEDRLAVQSVVEGAGLPIAIGATGVVLFALRTAGASVAVIIAVTVVVCVAWTAAAVLLYRDYARALVVALKHRLLRDAPVDVEHAETAAFLHEMLGSDDGRAVRLALDLLPSASEASGEHGELALLADDPRPDVYLPALVRLAEAGDGDAQARLRKTVRTLLGDPDSSRRAEALAAIGPADVDLVNEVVTALEVPATMSAAAAALGRLGDAALPRIAAVLAVLAAAGADPAPIAAALDRTLRADAEHFARCAAVRQVVGAGSELAHALGDELELLRRRVLALLAVRYGAEEIGAVANRLECDTDDRRSLAAETLDVTLTSADAVLALPLVRTDLPLPFRLQQLAAVAPVTPTDRAAVLEDILSDGKGHWRSDWLRACAAYESGSSCAREKAGRKPAMESFANSQREREEPAD